MSADSYIYWSDEPEVAEVWDNIDLDSLHFEYLKHDKEFILELLHDGSWDVDDIFPYLPDALTNDKRFMITATSVGSDSCMYASDSLKEDKNFVLDVLRVTSGMVGDILLDEVPDEFFHDREFVHKAAGYYGYILQFLPSEMTSDREIVKIAVSECPEALQFASDDLQAELIDWAAQRAKEIRNRDDLSVAIKYAHLGHALFRRLSGKTYAVLTAVRANGYLLKDASVALRADYCIVSDALQTHGGSLRYASAKLRANRRIVKIAVNQDGYAIRYADNSLKHDPEIVQLVKQQNYHALMYTTTLKRFIMGNKIAKSLMKHSPKMECIMQRAWAPTSRRLKRMYDEL